jgi:hypothetical protein
LTSPPSKAPHNCNYIYIFKVWNIHENLYLLACGCCFIPLLDMLCFIRN